jgi:hypothetical protein
LPLRVNRAPARTGAIAVHLHPDCAPDLRPTRRLAASA